MDREYGKDGMLLGLSFCGGVWADFSRLCNNPYRLMYRNFTQVMTEVVRSRCFLTKRAGNCVMTVTVTLHCFT